MILSNKTNVFINFVINISKKNTSRDLIIITNTNKHVERKNTKKKTYILNIKVKTKIKFESSKN